MSINKDDLKIGVKRWLDSGCHAHPCKADGSKIPLSVPKGSQEQDENGEYRYGWKRLATGEIPARTADQINQHIIDTGRSDGIGVFCGAASGNLEMVEVEGRAVELIDRVREAAKAYEVEQQFKELESGCAEKSAGGGIHFFLRVSDGECLGNTKLARRPVEGSSDVDVLAETRGTGGWAVVAPSGGRTHSSGNSYEFIAGGPETIPTFTCEQRDAIYAAFAVLDEMPPEEPVDPATFERKERPEGDILPGEDFAERASWDEILEGWTKLGNFGGRTQWRRPGKKSGHSSATTTETIFYCFSSSADMPHQKGMGKFATYAYIKHNGDMSAAAKQLSAVGFGSSQESLPDPLDELNVEEMVAEVEHSKTEAEHELERLEHELEQASLQELDAERDIREAWSGRLTQAVHDAEQCEARVAELEESKDFKDTVRGGQERRASIRKASAPERELDNMKSEIEKEVRAEQRKRSRKSKSLEKALDRQEKKLGRIGKDMDRADLAREQQRLLTNQQQLCESWGMELRGRFDLRPTRHFEMRIIEGIENKYILTNPAWSKELNERHLGTITIPATEITDAARVAQIIFEYTGKILVDNPPGFWTAGWLGTPEVAATQGRPASPATRGLLYWLIQKASTEQASLDESLSAAISGAIKGVIDSVPVSEEPDLDGGELRMVDGELIGHPDKLFDGLVTKFGQQAVHKYKTLLKSRAGFEVFKVELKNNLAVFKLTVNDQKEIEMLRNNFDRKRDPAKGV